MHPISHAMAIVLCKFEHRRLQQKVDGESEEQQGAQTEGGACPDVPDQENPQQAFQRDKQAAEGGHQKIAAYPVFEKIQVKTVDGNVFGNG